ncbi:MAG TPA: adenylate/guanylate cyclase domain-containing protein, partial [Chitinophagaceae bacterium]|nr:adenylate/guanylate cyclase domain-containing protein [Chitinophagaceae bacterium]
YTTIGDAVNIAQRLQTVAHEGQIVITETCYEKIKESFNCRKISEMSLKNKTHPVMVYEVLD